MIRMPGISIRSRVMAKVVPKADISNRSIGIFVVDHAPMKIRILLNLTPFFIKTAATGKAPYRGPAAAEPIRKASTIPFHPDFSPMYFIMTSLGTQVSRIPNRIKMGGMTRSISFRLNADICIAFVPAFRFNKYKMVITTT